MKKEVLHDALNLLDDEMVREVEELRSKYLVKDSVHGEAVAKRKGLDVVFPMAPSKQSRVSNSQRAMCQWGNYRRWASLVACVCVAVVVAAVMSHSGILQMGKKESSLETEMVKNESAVMPSSECVQVSTREETPEEKKEEVIKEEIDENEEKEAAEEEELAVEGVVIPKMEVDLDKNSGVMADMLAFFIWQGRLYVEYERGLADVDFVGEYLGTATGSIDEWTKKDGYVDFAGSINGDFYAVEGYDTSFMLCMKWENELVSTFINGNDMILSTGADLFEDRLHLRGNYEAVKYQTRDDWQRSTGVIAEISDEDLGVVERFVNAVNEASFLLTEDVPLEEGEKNIYDREIYHVFFEMENGMTVHMRLYKGGYVRFQGVIPACVKVDEDVFEEMVNVMSK